MLKTTNIKTIDDLLIDLDNIVKDSVNKFIQKNSYAYTNEAFYASLEKSIINTTNLVLKKLEDLSIYKAKTPLDYEKIAKIIVNTHDIIEKFFSEALNKIIISNKITSNESHLNKLPPLIRKYYREYDSFVDIKNTLKTEGNYTFDGEGSFVNYNENYFSDIFVQATDAEDVLSQTDLIFKTSFITDSKKIYIISDQIPKENLKDFFILNEINIEEIAELKEKLETIRFLILSTKVFTENFQNENTNIQYFFNIVFCSSLGFNNEYNKTIFDIFYDGDFNALTLLFGKAKPISDKEANIKIKNYIKSLFFYFLNKINFKYFYQDGHVNKPVSFFLSYLYALTFFYLKNDPISKELRSKINNIKHKFTIIECKKKKNLILKNPLLTFKLYKQKKIITNLLKKRKERKINNDYNLFINCMQEFYIEECNLGKIKINQKEFNFSDEEIIFFVFSDYGTGFQKLSYTLKDKTKEDERIKYEQVKRFKKYLLFRIIEIFNVFNAEHIKKLHFIFYNMKFGMPDLQLGLLAILNNLLLKGNLKRNFINNQFVNSFKIELLSTVFYPSSLKSKNYKKLTNFILDFNSEFELSSVHQLIIDKFNEIIIQNNELTPHTFLKFFDLSNYDLRLILNILKNNENSQLTKYINYRLNEFPVQKRLLYLLEELNKHNNLGIFSLFEITNSEGNTINLSNFIKNDDIELVNDIELKINSLEYVCFILFENEKHISLILTDSKQIIVFLENDSLYTINEINNIFIKVITQN